VNTHPTPISIAFSKTITLNSASVRGQATLLTIMLKLIWMTHDQLCSTISSSSISSNNIKITKFSNISNSSETIMIMSTIFRGWNPMVAQIRRKPYLKDTLLRTMTTATPCLTIWILQHKWCKELTITRILLLCISLKTDLTCIESRLRNLSKSKWEAMHIV